MRGGWLALCIGIGCSGTEVDVLVRRDLAPAVIDGGLEDGGRACRWVAWVAFDGGVVGMGGLLHASLV